MNKMSPGSGLWEGKKKATGFIAHVFKVIGEQLLYVFEMLEEVGEYIRGCGDG